MDKKFTGKPQNINIYSEMQYDYIRYANIKEFDELERPKGAFKTIDEFQEYVLFNQELVSPYLELINRHPSHGRNVPHPISLCKVYIVLDAVHEYPKTINPLYVPVFDELIYPKMPNEESSFHVGYDKFSGKPFLFSAYGDLCYNPQNEYSLPLRHYDYRKFMLVDKGRTGNLMIFPTLELAQNYVSQFSPAKWTGVTVF